MDFGGFFRERRFYESPLAVSAYRGFRGAAARVGLDVVLKTFYSPIPDLAALPADTFERRSTLPGLHLDLDAQLRLLEEHREAMAAFRPDGYAPEEAHVSYGPLDATVLYGLLRSARPARIVELGSGHSTLVTAQVARENAAEGHPCALDVYDPYPSVVQEDLAGVSSLHRVAAQDVPMAVFERLGPGDVLFVDTTHVVKLGSDVTHIVLEVLPRLAPGVLVHVHDIFLPYEYPRRWPENFGLFWSEQYLLQAFLSMNPSFEILVSVAALHRDRRAELTRVMPPQAMVQDGSAFWMRRSA
jgi:predicted O-methyltransferase YrrM